MPAQGTGTALGLGPHHGWDSPDDFHWQPETLGSDAWMHHEINTCSGGLGSLCQGELWLFPAGQDGLKNLFQPQPFCGSAQSSQHHELTHKYRTLSPALLWLGRIFPLGVSSCFPVCTICIGCTRRGGEDKHGDTAQITAELRKLLQEIQIPGLRCAMNHCPSPPAVPLEFPKKRG